MLSGNTLNDSILSWPTVGGYWIVEGTGLTGGDAQDPDRADEIIAAMGFVVIVVPSTGFLLV